MYIRNAAPVMKNLPGRSAVSAVTGFSRARRSIRGRGTCGAAGRVRRQPERNQKFFWRFYTLRDDEIMPLICPTCQDVLSRPIGASVAGLLCMGLSSIFW
jgi:hypothetical protein